MRARRSDCAEKPGGEAGKIDARLRRLFSSSISVADAPVERSEARGKRRKCVLIATSRGDLFEELLEADLAVASPEAAKRTLGSL